MGRGAVALVGTGERSGEGWAMPAIMAVVVALAVGVAAGYIRNGAVDVVYSDTWGYLRMVDGFLSGSFDPWEMVRPHNQNRSVVLTAVLLGSALLDHFDQKAIMFLGVAFATLTTVLMIAVAHRLLRTRPAALAALSLVVSLSLMSLI